MYSCSECSDLLLDFLYGLMEPEEVQRLRAHLADCPACREALAAAEAQQRLLAQAARVAREVPAFVAPSESVISEASPPPPEAAVPAPHSAAPETLPLPRAHGRVFRRWAWLATAAALLLVAGGVYWSYEDGLMRRQVELTQAKREVDAVDARLVSSARTYKEELERLPGQVRERELRLQIAGPATYQAGAPAQVRVLTQDAKGRPRAAEVDVTVVDPAAKKTLLKQKIETAGETVVVLPAALQVQSGIPVQLVVKAGTERGAEAQLSEVLSTTGPSYDTQVVLNKPAYRPGEVLSFRTLTLDRFSQKPPGRELPLVFTVRDGPKMVRELTGKAHPDGVAGGEFPLGGLPVGTDYSLEVASAGGGNGGQVLSRSSRFVILPAEMGFFANFAANNAQANQLNFDRNGKDAAANARLQQENLVAPSYPEAEFFPEGGDLIAGVSNRVYFRAQTPQGVPTDVQGQVVDRAGKTVTTAKSQWEGAPALRGLGTFTFTPQAAESYTFQVDVSAQRKKVVPMPRVHRAGIALSVPDSVAPEGEPITAVVRSSEPVSQLLALATCRGHVVDQLFFGLAGKDTKIRLNPVPGTRGILRLTVYEMRQHDLLPRAERLIYRTPAERLIVSCADGSRNQTTYRPGEHVELGIQVKNEKGEPADAALLAAAVNDGVLLFSQPEQGPPAFFYLASEIRDGADLENADFLVSGTPQARTALDLFLGTEGWRRISAPDEVAGLDKTLVSGAPSIERLAVFNHDNSAEIAARSVQLLAAGQEELRHKAVQERASLQDKRDRHIQAVRAATTALRDYEQLPGRSARLAVGVLVLLCLVAGGVLLAIGFVRILLGRRPTAAFGSAFASLLLCLVLYGATSAWREQSGTRDDAGWAFTDERQQQHLPQVSMPRSDLQEAETVKRSAPVGRFREAPEQRAATELSTANTKDKARTRMLSEDNLRRGLQEQLSKGTLQQFMKKPIGQSGTGGFGSNQTRSGGAPPPPGPAGAAPATRAARTAEEKANNEPAAKMSLQQPPASAPASPPQANSVQVLRTYAYRNSAALAAFAPDTLLWYPALVAANGTARISFDVPEQPASYRLLLYANSPSGRLGAYRGQIITRK